MYLKQISTKQYLQHQYQHIGGKRVQTYHIMINISSAFLHAGDQVDKVGLVVMQEGRREIVVSGCGRDY